MRLALKVLFTLLFVAVVPVAVGGVTSQLIAKDALIEATSEKIAADARHLAELSETTLLKAMDDLALTSSLRFDRLTKDELHGALSLIYRDDVRRNAVALIDGKTGEPVVDLVYQEETSTEPGLKGHEIFNDASLAAFASHIPLQDALRSRRAISPPYADAARGIPLVALAVLVDGPLEKGAPRPWVVAVELSLRSLNRRFEEVREEGQRATLVDLEGRVVLDTNIARALSRTDVSAHPGAKMLADPMASTFGVLPELSTTEFVTAYARAEQLASPTGKTWGVIVERPRKEALARVDTMASRSMFWVGTALLLALVFGFVLSRGITYPVEVLARAVERFGKGEHDARATLPGKDEIALLARRFNGMADAIVERDRELRTFNDQLQVRVDERTRELKDAQDQLIRSQKAAAVGELGAGVAHEINNPLAAVLGSAQLALLRTDDKNPAHPHLRDIEKEALRIRDIVESLLKLSVDGDKRSASVTDVNDAVESALALVARPIIAQRIQVKRELSSDLPKIRGVASDLQQAIMQLLVNAKEAMPDGGTLTIRTENVDKKLVKLIIEDTGRGIADQNLEKIYEPFFTTRAGQGHKGMGLAVVHKIVEDHGARITVESRLGKGTSFRIVFPATREALHLA